MCLFSQSPDWYLIWIGSDQEKTFGPTISGLIKRNLGPERMTLWDSRQRGSPRDFYFGIELLLIIVSTRRKTRCHETHQRSILFLGSRGCIYHFKSTGKYGDDGRL